MCAWTWGAVHKGKAGSCIDCFMWPKIQPLRTRVSLVYPSLLTYLLTYLLT